MTFIKEKNRVNVPKGTKTSIIAQDLQKPYIIYNGTQANLNVRLRQHLFNESNEKTGKLGIKIDTGKLKKFKWYVFYWEIDDIVMRNAIETWWRINIGWPPFCKR